MHMLKLSPKGRTFVGGDIHGELDLLLQELEKVGFDKSVDVFIATGDLIDRGPKSLEAIKLIQEPWFETVLGNHEDLAYKSFFGETEDIRNENFGCWFQNGGKWYFDLPPESQNEFQEILKDSVSKLPYLIEISMPDGRKIGVAHASVPGRDWEQLSAPLSDIQREAAIWHRGPANDIQAALESPWDDWEEDYIIKNIDQVYLGHTPARTPFSGANLTFIDTGAFHTGKLTVIEL